MLTNRRQTGTSAGPPRFQIFRRGKQWLSPVKDTAVFQPSTRQNGNNGRNNLVSGGIHNRTSFPVNDVTTAQGIIWVDAVGGFLAVPNDTIRIGQALPDNRVELPIIGDISRQHAVIQRSGEDYLLMPHSRTRVDARLVGGLTRLSDGDEIELNDTVRLRFRKPHPLSNSARLEILSHHRTQPSVDGILLIGQNLLFGPQSNNHVVCRNWTQSMALQVSGERPKVGTGTDAEAETDGENRLGFRFQSAEPVQVNDAAASHTGCIEWGERLTGENFALVLERL